MTIRALLLFALCGMLNAKIMVLDNASELRELFWFPRPRPQPSAPTSGPGYQRGVAAAGFQHDRGMMWSVICNSQHGMVPGKMDSRGEAWYPWGGREWGCPNVAKVVNGRLVSWDQPLPSGCAAQGSQKDSGSYHAALIKSGHGLVPGKAKKERREGWYCWGGREISVRSNYYFIC